MKKNIPNLLLIGLVCCLLNGCDQPVKEKVESNEPVLSATIADTITVDVTLKALDTTSFWDVEQHKYINQKALVDYVFDGIYSKKLKVYDFNTGVELKIKDIKEIEVQPKYSREMVSKIQFKELWFIDSAGNLQKKTYSYTLGLEQYSEMGTFLGHKALFTVKLQ